MPWLAWATCWLQQWLAEVAVMGCWALRWERLEQRCSLLLPWLLSAQEYLEPRCLEPRCLLPLEAVGTE